MKREYLLSALLIVCIAALMSSCNLWGTAKTAEETVTDPLVYWSTLLDVSDVCFTKRSGSITGLSGPFKDFNRCSRITVSKVSSSEYSFELYVTENNKPVFEFSMTDAVSGSCTDSDFGITVSAQLCQGDTDTLVISKDDQIMVFGMQEIEL